MSAYRNGSVSSADGTIIGYRQLGSGPAVLVLHGGMQASQHMLKLAGTLSAAFTVCLPDRRGRGLSGATVTTSASCGRSKTCRRWSPRPERRGPSA